MSTLTIRKLDDALKAKLRLKAAQDGCSMEEEARRILRRGLLATPSSLGLGSRLVSRFSNVDGTLPSIERSLPRTVELGGE